jgi:sugar phosphate isomerase/epimerase
VKLGFVSAILPDHTLAEVAAFARAEGFACVELMCWPRGRAERRYAGVTHVDVDDFDPARVRAELGGVEISGLGYYPNPLSPDRIESRTAVAHLKKVIRAAERLGVGVVNTFVGRDWTKSVDANWPAFRHTWKPLLRFAAGHGVRIGIENCPMWFTSDEWPGGKNLAASPAVWRRMFDEFPDRTWGLNYDPSHLVWQGMDPLKPLKEFGPRLVHVHAKDAVLDRARLDDVGVLANPLEYHRPVLPGRGDVDWVAFFKALGGAGYTGPVCIEVEDREFEKTRELRREGLRRSARFLRRRLPA